MRVKKRQGAAKPSKVRSIYILRTVLSLWFRCGLAVQALSLLGL